MACVLTETRSVDCLTAASGSRSRDHPLGAWPRLFCSSCRTVSSTRSTDKEARGMPQKILINTNMATVFFLKAPDPCER